MPTNLIKSTAKRTKLSIEDVESEWEKAKRMVKHFLRTNSRGYWGVVTRIFKKRIAARVNISKSDRSQSNP